MSFKLGSFFTKFISWLVIFSLAGICLLISIITFYGKDLPDYRELANYSPNIVTRVYAADGKLIEEYAKEHRLFVPISSISKNLISAFLAAEDKNFYQHPGLDYQGLLRALVYNAQNIGSRNLMGGSTITQQVVKNFLLTNEKSLTRKIKEALLAIRISKTYTKNQILELYLNQIYLGSRSYGVASAAVNYFNKSIDDLTINESALLAAMPQAPSMLDPRKHPERAKARRDWVIKRMASERFISDQEAKEAILEPIKLRKKTAEELTKAPFFAEETRKQLLGLYGTDMLYGGGLSVSSTLDSKLQEIAEKALEKGLIRYDRKHGYRGKVTHIPQEANLLQELKKIRINGLKSSWKLAAITGIKDHEIKLLIQNSAEEGIVNIKDINWVTNGKKLQTIFKIGDVVIVSRKKDNCFLVEQLPEIEGAIIAMNPHNGAIKAMSGGWDFNYSRFNRATQAMRHPGSSFKTFVFLAALENGFTPSSIFVDEPIQIVQGPYLPLWEPQNYGKVFFGPMTLRAALEKSSNIVVIKLIQEIGVNKVIELAKRFGISNIPNHLSIALGAVETTPLQMVTAYSMIANGGKKIQPFLIDKIQDKNGKTIFKSDPRECSNCLINSLENESEITTPSIPNEKEMVTDERSAFQLISMLEGAASRGTAKKAATLKRTFAGKTGTSNDSSDTWFIGFTPNLVVAVYLGFDHPKSMGKYETGTSAALPICLDFFQEALKDTPDIPFRIPQGIKSVKVDYDTGLPLANSKHYIYEAFKIGTEPTLENPEKDEQSLIEELFQESNPENIPFLRD